MGKTSRKMQTDTAGSTLNESSSVVHDDPVEASSDLNIAGNVVNVMVDDTGEKEENTHESKVWKFATKIGSEKARCNICLMGKITVVNRYSHIFRINFVSREYQTFAEKIRNQIYQ